MKRLLPLVLAAVLSLALAGDSAANGRETQREIQARVVSVDPQAGTLVVERQLRGKTWRLTLRVPPGAPIFTCSQAAATLAELNPGDIVSVYYEAVGREGVANLVVVEPRE